MLPEGNEQSQQSCYDKKPFDFLFMKYDPNYCQSKDDNPHIVGVIGKGHISPVRRTAKPVERRNKKSGHFTK